MANGEVAFEPIERETAAPRFGRSSSSESRLGSSPQATRCRPNVNLLSGSRSPGAQSARRCKASFRLALFAGAATAPT